MVEAIGVALWIPNFTMQARPLGKAYPASAKAFQRYNESPMGFLSLQVDRICLSFRNTLFSQLQGRICVICV